MDNISDQVIGSLKHSKKYTFDDLMNGKLPCFAAGTLVSTENGLKRIEQIKVGEKVLSRNMRTLVNEWKTVTEVHENFALKMVKIDVEDESLVCTGSHRFWVPKAQVWAKAHTLQANMEIYCQNGETQTIEKVHIIPTRHTTYNLSVEHNNNYYVGKNGLLTHNASKGPSIFANPTLNQVEFYHLKDAADKAFYAGQTTQGIGIRAQQHINDLTKSWKRKISNFGWAPGIKGKFAMSAYEAAIIELYEIQQLRLKGGSVYNAQKPIGAKKFNKFKNMGNPCRFFV